MNNRTRVYLLFKEYVDIQRNPSKWYILGEEFPLNIQSLNSIFDEILSALNFFDYEGAEYYYDKDNLKGALYQAEVCSQFFPGYITMVLSQLKNCGVTEWQASPTIKGEVFLHKYDISNDMLAEVSSNADVSVLFHNDAISVINNTIKIYRKNEIVEIHCAHSIKDLHTWFSVNRKPQRKYDFNIKHGDANHKAQRIRDKHGKRAAQLLTNESDTRALLNKAIGKGKDSDLWFYDSERSKFVYFENQNEFPPAFHGYHLSLGEKNSERIDLEKLKIIQEIPEFI